MSARTVLGCVAAAAMFAAALLWATGEGSASGRETARSYVGPETCEKCHPRQARTWHDSSHSTSFDSLLPEHLGMKDEEGRECISCHVTGHDAGGFAMRDAASGLRHVSCEACHGPGSAHAALMQEARKERRKVEGDFRISTDVDCQRCHNPHVSYRKLYGPK